MKVKRYVRNLKPNNLWLFRKRKISETAKVRSSLTEFCKGDGLDIGFGGDPIIPNAICLDLPSPYAHYSNHPQHLHGDAQDLYWFRDECLDFVYSSHLLEDFEDTEIVLKEWLRVLKPGGNLVLFLPDEQMYREYCRSQGNPPNGHHIHEYFSLAYVRKCIDHWNDIEIIHERFPIGIYSFELVLRKKISCLA